jgi:hypothetical protein
MMMMLSTTGTVMVMMMVTATATAAGRAAVMLVWKTHVDTLIKVNNNLFSPSAALSVCVNDKG